MLIIIEAVLLAVVAVLAAWSGFAAAKWGTESWLDLAKASAARTEANRAAYQAADLKNFDALTFNAWFSAYVAGNKNAMQVAERRFRPQFLVAFNAWLATRPFTNTHAPAGPTYMPQYAQPELAQANLLDAHANRYYALGETAANTSDGYIRTRLPGHRAVPGGNERTLPRPRGPDGSHRRRRNHPGPQHRLADPGAQTTIVTRARRRSRLVSQTRKRCSRRRAISNGPGKRRRWIERRTGLST